MSGKIPYNISNHSINVILDGETFTIKKGDPNFEKALQACLSEDWDAIPLLISKGKGIEHWARGLFEFKDNYLYYKGSRVPDGLNNRFIAMAQNGRDPGVLTKFYERLAQNPSYRALQQTYRFLENSNIPLDQDGFIVAYKAVKHDYWDKYTGKSFCYKPGAVIEMPRNQISDDPKKTCAPGLHIGGLSYLGSQYSSDKWMLVRVDPKDVVSVPVDYNSQKMRACRMEVIGEFTGKLPDDYVELKKAETTAPRAEAPRVTKEEPEANLFLSAGVEALSAAMFDTLVDYLREQYDADEDVYTEGTEPFYIGPKDDAENLAEEFQQSYPSLGITMTWGDKQKDFPPLEPAGKEENLTYKEHLQGMTLKDLRALAKGLGIKNVKGIRGGKSALIDVLLARGEGKPAEAKKEEPKPKPKPKRSNAAWDSLDKMDKDELSKHSLKVLRPYASKHLDIKGASKIPGGKSALIEAILKNR